MIRILPMIVRVEKRRNDASKPSSRSSKKDKAPTDSIQDTFLLINPKTKKKNYNIDQNEDCILGLSTVIVDKKIKELIKKDELTIADLEGVGLRMLKRQYKNDVELEYHVEQYHVEVIEDMIPDRWSKKIHLYQIDALNGIHHWEDARKDFFKAKMGNRSSDKVYSDKRIISVVKVNVKRKWGYGFLMSIVMVNENILGRGNMRLDGRGWSKNDIKRSNDMLEKIDKTLKLKEQLRRLEEYVGERPKIFDPHTFVRP
ncbi:hypothetical protein Tco_0661740 [Tanacetum coccineum]